MMTSKVTIAGKRVYYRDWRSEVVRLADAQSLPDLVRDQITEPMLRDSWAKNERAEYFIAKCVEYFASPEPHD
jgi:hypothetical protein